MTTRFKVLEEQPCIFYQIDSDFGRASAAEMFSTIGDLLDTEKTYNELITFHLEADLTHIKQVDFLIIMEAMKASYEQSGIKRAKTAIVVGLSEPLRPMTSLWVGFCELDPEISAKYQSFYELDKACEWLGVSKDLVVDFLHDEEQ